MGPLLDKLIMEDSDTISPQSRRQLWITTWLVAGIATIIPNLLVTPIALLFAWLFPLGLFRLIFSPDNRLDSNWGWFELIGGWLFYGYLTVFAISQNRKNRFFVAYTILCIFLILNVVGCNKMLNDPIKDSL
jgi:hypothetical protein